MQNAFHLRVLKCDRAFPHRYRKETNKWHCLIIRELNSNFSKFKNCRIRFEFIKNLKPVKFMFNFLKSLIQKSYCNLKNSRKKNPQD
jgi:hypothetical protein